MEQLAKAAAAIEAGNVSEAHVLLAQAIKANPNDVDAWLLLSRTASSAEQKKTFLKRALIVDPDNETARQGLVELEGTPEPEPVAVAEEQPSPDEALPAEGDVAAVATGDEVTVVVIPPTPPSNALADTIVVGAPEVTLTTSAQPEVLPDATLPEETFADPFDFDSQEEEVPDWLLGEVAAVETESATEATPEPAPEAPDEVTAVVAAEGTTGAAQEEEQVAPEPAAQPAAAAATVQASGKAEPKKPAPSSSAWLEWLITALVLLLFLTIIYMIAV